MFQVKERANELEREGKDLIHFEIGDTCYNIPRSVKRAMLLALIRNKTHYCSSYGLYDFRKKIAEKHMVGVENVIICPANMALFMSLSLLCNPGDSLQFPTPGFPTYFAIAKYLGLKQTKGKAKVKIINYPNNPTGECKEDNRKDAKYYIYDNAYDGIQYNGKVSYKIANNTVNIFSFSKTHAMPGLRLGYIIASKEFIDKCAKLMETTWSCVPEFIQYGGLKALDIEGYKYKELKLKRDLTCAVLDLKGYKFKIPDGGIYVWVKSKYKNGNKDFEELLEKGVVVCPGEAFGKKGFFRICFARNKKDLEEGLRRI